MNGRLTNYFYFSSANEFTFASTTGAWIPYGEAGDCYSRRNCPQGTFSINLAGTGLQIGSSVRWSEKGTNKPINVQIYHVSNLSASICETGFQPTHHEFLEENISMATCQKN